MTSKDKNQTVVNCNLCGACNLSCPIYNILLKESAGPRFKAFLEKNNDFRMVFFMCTECGSCVQDCPASISLDCLKAREHLVSRGKEPSANKTMRVNIKQYGNPFGDLSKRRKTNIYYT